MSSTMAACGHYVPAVGYEGSLARRRCERLPCLACAELAGKFKAKASEYRATLFPGGQQMNCWLPKGEYIPRNVVSLCVDRDTKQMADARELVDHNGDVWYIGEAIYQQASA